MRFVIIAAPRTGSTHLTSLLNEQKDIACHGEIFHPKKVFVRWPREQKSQDIMEKLMQLRERSAQEFLDYICANSGAYRHVGFKIFSGHNDRFLETLISDDSIRKIVLWRSNLLASYSSSLIARGTFGRKPSKPPEPRQVRFDAARFVAYGERHCAFYRSMFERLNAANQVFFTVHYEQINDPWLFASLVSFIGGNPENLVARSRREKLNTSAILSRFTNPADVTEFLRIHDLNGWEYESPISLDPFQIQKGDQGTGD
ncbi:MAG TPA: hypothetical protein VHT03_00390 [Rhizomicrobium sp.]|jgi:hypothetical protein|nr:hypothetical protein [Rhizomicrobium sp.]